MSFLLKTSPSLSTVSVFACVMLALRRAVIAAECVPWFVGLEEFLCWCLPISRIFFRPAMSQLIKQARCDCITLQGDSSR